MRPCLPESGRTAHKLSSQPRPHNADVADCGNEDHVPCVTLAYPTASTGISVEWRTFACLPGGQMSSLTKLQRHSPQSGQNPCASTAWPSVQIGREPAKKCSVIDHPVLRPLPFHSFDWGTLGRSLIAASAAGPAGYVYPSGVSIEATAQDIHSPYAISCANVYGRGTRTC